MTAIRQKQRVDHTLPMQDSGGDVAKHLSHTINTLLGLVGLSHTINTLLGLVGLPVDKYEFSRPVGNVKATTTWQYTV